MPKNAKQRGPVYWFITTEVIPELSRARGHNVSFMEALSVGNPRFKNLTAEQKEPYKRMEKEWKKTLRGREGDKYRIDNVGQVMSERRDKRAEARHKWRNVIESIKQQLGDDMQAWLDQKWYFIAFEYQCEYQEEGEIDDLFKPVEMGMAEYSLSEGVTKKLHVFIDPGEVPKGFRSHCQIHMVGEPNFISFQMYNYNTGEQTHKIPYEQFEKSESAYPAMFVRMKKFVNPENQPPWPPVFCLTNAPNETKFYEMHECCLQFMRDRSFDKTPAFRTLCSAETLVAEFFTLAGEAAPSEGWRCELLSSSPYDYHAEARCEWHNDVELEGSRCALNTVMKMCYGISDGIVKSLLKMNLTSKHIPVTGGTESFTSVPSFAPVTQHFGFGNRAQAPVPVHPPVTMDADDDDGPEIVNYGDPEDDGWTTVHDVRKKGRQSHPRDKDWPPQVPMGAIDSRPLPAPDKQEGPLTRKPKARSAVGTASSVSSFNRGLGSSAGSGSATAAGALPPDEAIRGGGGGRGILMRSAPSPAESPSPAPSSTSSMVLGRGRGAGRGWINNGAAQGATAAAPPASKGRGFGRGIISKGNESSGLQARFSQATISSQP